MLFPISSDEVQDDLPGRPLDPRFSRTRHARIEGSGRHVTLTHSLEWIGRREIDRGGDRCSHGPPASLKKHRRPTPV